MSFVFDCKRVVRIFLSLETLPFRALMATLDVVKVIIASVITAAAQL